MSLSVRNGKRRGQIGAHTVHAIPREIAAG